MTTRGQINSNFYQIVNVDVDGNPTEVKPEYIQGMEAAVANVHITGGTANYLLKTDGAGNLTWAAPASTNSIVNGTSNVSINTANGNITIGVNSTSNAVVISEDGITATTFYGNVVGNISGNIVVPGVNTSVIFNTDGNADGVTTFTFNKDTDVLAVTNITANGAGLTNLLGANVVGSVAQANISNVANSVSVANVSGIGNIATINLDGNAGNILYGNGVFSAVPDVGNANSANYANYANFAGNVTIAAQPNVTSLGNLVNLQFNNTVTPITAATGQMFWDTGEHTISLGMENGVTQQIGLENFIYVKASSAITDGQVVMFTGANGNNVNAAPANAASAGFKAEYILGIATQDIATNGFGYITVFGQVHGLDTLAYTVGDILWYDPTSTTGGLTATQPTDPAYQIRMGVVTKRAGGDGHIAVQIDVIGTLNLLTDVTITTPTTGQSLVYNGTNVWVNGNPAVANSANALNSSISNVIITGGTTGQAITTDGAGNLSFSSITSTPGGSDTQLQFNNAGSFGGISNVTFASGNLSLGNIANVKITGGTSNFFARTDGAGNLSWQAITSNLTVATRSVAVNIGITNYQMNVEARSGNVVVNVN